MLNVESAKGPTAQSTNARDISKIFILGQRTFRATSATRDSTRERASMSIIICTLEIDHSRVNTAKKILEMGHLYTDIRRQNIRTKMKMENN